LPKNGGKNTNKQGTPDEVARPKKKKSKSSASCSEGQTGNEGPGEKEKKDRIKLKKKRGSARTKTPPHGDGPGPKPAGSESRGTMVHQKTGPEKPGEHGRLGGGGEHDAVSRGAGGQGLRGDRPSEGGLRIASGGSRKLSFHPEKTWTGRRIRQKDPLPKKTGSAPHPSNPRPKGKKTGKHIP